MLVIRNTQCRYFARFDVPYKYPIAIRAYPNVSAVILTKTMYETIEIPVFFETMLLVVKK